ncbi:MAG: DUF4345 domain-containing protein [Methylocystis sp.]|uniref:DUF4345 domain-containing protein n=1 Tax=Methylocystis sp. TaxID=1911079 RepID=UPI003DA5A2AD
MQIKKFYLVFAFVSVSAIALLYGVAPAWFAQTFLGVANIGVGCAHILRAIMGLYVALGLFWFYAAFDARYRRVAVLTTVIFCAGLVSGRLISFAIDGLPPPLLLFYAALEFVLAPIGLWVYNRPD